MNNVELTKEIETLKEEVKMLQGFLTNVGMPYELKEIIRNEVVKGVDSVTSPTRQELITGTPFDLTLPATPNTLLVIKWRAKEYKLLAIEV